MNSVYTITYICVCVYVYGAEQYYCGHMTKFTSRGVLFSCRSKRSKRIIHKRKSFVRMCVGVYILYVYVYIGNVDANSSCTLQSFTFTLIPNYLAVRPLLVDPKGALFLRNFTNVKASTFASISPYTPCIVHRPSS